MTYRGDAVQQEAERATHGGQLCPYGHCNPCLNVATALRSALARAHAEGLEAGRREMAEKAARLCESRYAHDIASHIRSLIPAAPEVKDG